MYKLKKIGKVFTSKYVGTGPSSYKKNYRAAVLQRLRNTGVMYTFARSGCAYLSHIPHLLHTIQDLSGSSNTTICSPSCPLSSSS